MKKAKRFSALLIAFMLIVSCFSGLSISASAASATKTVWFDPGKASDGSPVWFAWTWDGVTDSWSKGTESGNYITFDNIGNKMIILRMPKGSTKGDWDTCWNRTDTIDVSKSDLVTFKAWGNDNYFTVTTGTYAGGEVPSSAAPDPEPTTRPAAAGGNTADDYYLCGYINGANYGVEEDYKTLGAYYFTNGTLTTSFSGVTWVGVKTGDNKNWYFYDGEEGCTETSAVLTKDAAEKMFIPAGVEVTLTLTVNKDDTVTLSYETGAEVPTEAPVTETPVTEPTTRPAPAGGNTADDYYLCGYINGANYGVEEDYKTLGAYYFTNGTLTTSFSGVTWVGVKTGDNKNWYFYDGEEGCTDTSAVLTKDAPEKMFIPAGVEVTLTLTVNKDDTVTLSYETGAEVPTDAPVTVAPVTEPTTRPAPAGGNTADDYYLCGYINGANYGVEEDYKTLGAYYFTNGTLTTSFSGVTWVGVKTGDNKNWYFYDGEEGCTETTAVLTKDAPEKMFIPAGVEVTLTLTVNKDDTVTLSYETGATIPTEPTQPTEPYTGEGTKGDYYLCGYINGANYGVEEDYETLGDYHFVGGKLTATFTGVTWVGVKTADNKNWYFYDGEEGCTETTAVLTKDSPEKMFIPADVEVTLTLEENADGTLTLSYTTGGDEPTTNEPEETTAPVTEAPEIITPGFYIIGSKEVCGAEWSFEPWKYGVPMTQLGDSNIFTQTFTNVASSANAYDSTGAHRYEFKVVYVSEKGGITWHPGGMGNSTFVTVADNDSTLTFTFKLLAASPNTEGQYPEAVVCEVKSPFEPSTQAPTTQAPTTQAPETQAPTTQQPVTEAPTTQAPTTQAPTTQQPVTEAPTTQAPTTQQPVTEAPTTQAPATEPAKKDISGWKVEGIKNKTYTGNLIKQKFDVVSSEGEYAKYTVEYRNNKKVGTATVIIKGKGDYTGTIKKTFKITKANNPMTVKAVAKTASIKTLKKKAATVKGALSVKNNQGAVTYAKVAKGSSKFLTINKKGVITVKKGSTYKKNRKLKINVKVTAKGNASYKAGSKTITLTIKLK